MPINNITQTISELPAAGRRGIDVQTQFVIKQEDFQDHLQGTTVTELNTLKDQLNTRIGEINSTATTMNGYATSASSSASTATTKAGEASTSATAALNSKNQASTFATNSSNSATKASQWADNNYNVEVEVGKYSAKHWSTVAQNASINKVDKVTSTDNAIVRFDGTTGAVQNSNVIINDSGKVAIKQTLNTSEGGISIENATGTATAVLSVIDTGQLILRNVAIDTLAITNGNTLHISPLGAIGYGVGAGGTVIQATSKATSVTLNKPSGRVITNDQALAAGSSIYFGVYNSVVGINDSIIITQNDMGTYTAANYDIKVVYQANGLIGINIKNISASTLSDVIIFRFEVIKGAIA